MTTSQLIGGRYQLLEPLGSGSQGETFLAATPKGDRVVVKKFTVAAMAGWKSLELFQREIDTLRNLHHDQIPTFIDAVEEADAHYLVQQHIEGHPLSDLITDGAFSEDELRAVAHDVLEVLRYMHNLVPPVVHRDLKPSNIIRRPDGTHVVVDFGGVQNIVAKDTGGSTVIGTTGYMPSEQLIGRAVPQSDIYALGATLAHLATAKHPAQLPTRRLVLEWRPSAKLTGTFADMIDRMLAPAPEDRPTSEQLLQNRLRGVGTGVERPNDPTPRSNALVPRRDEVPAELNNRFRTNADALFIDLALDTTPRLLIPIGGFAFIGFMLAATTGTAAPLVGAVAAGVAVAGVVSQLFRASERLTVYRDGTFEHRWSDGQTRQRTEGVLTGSIAVRSTGLRLRTERGVLDAGTGLGESQLEAVATELGNWLKQNGTAVATSTELVAATTPIEDRVAFLGSRLTLTFPDQDEHLLFMSRIVVAIGAVLAVLGHVFGHGFLHTFGLAAVVTGAIGLLLHLFPASRKLTVWPRGAAVLEFYDLRTRASCEQRGQLRLSDGRLLIEADGAAPIEVDPSLTAEDAEWLMSRVESLVPPAVAQRAPNT